MARALIAVLLFTACSEDSGRMHGAPHDAAVADLAVATDGPGSNSSDGAPSMSCLPDSLDQNGCACAPVGAVRVCYSGDPSTRNAGTCKDGTQTCEAHGEFAGFGACTGQVTPVAESCADGLDNNCDGKVDCFDPTCATDAACMTACTNGQTRACYTGPSGTLDVGTCRGGMQTCANNQWPTNCPGEVLPAAENCSDAKDHDCNHLPGCLDLFACITSPACMATCDPMKVDPGCSCPKGAGDTATCPEGTLGKTVGASVDSPGRDECCPCTAGDCGNPGCCGETVCAGNSQCAGLTCKPLPASCKGQVNFDCDDFPEDCDEPCCKCTNCP